MSKQAAMSSCETHRKLFLFFLSHMSIYKEFISGPCWKRRVFHGRGSIVHGRSRVIGGRGGVRGRFSFLVFNLWRVFYGCSFCTVPTPLVYLHVLVVQTGGVAEDLLVLLWCLPRR